ncbi:hypothetical protein [Pelagovum pacificum]|uniref:Uncharacterized protein n=1 Tax=Pelagovum pacificum TaxID=2588711 RepID=A0A5C5GF60_9RHOB|nr:hypothetical protein [Pelagovum pacificum]QQA44664.1 hypothetical protein I8N54_08885 [Pelagovum pacificum]TNY32226.1 hypothetical protein FHY64_02710 [Pelagovum pacificum]
MQELRWLMRAKRWANRPPSESRVKLVIGAIVITLAIAGFATFVGWPDWAQTDGVGRNAVRIQN